MQFQSRYSCHHGFSSCHCSAKTVFRSLAASFGAVNDGIYRVFPILLLFLNFFGLALVPTQDCPTLVSGWAEADGSVRWLETAPSQTTCPSRIAEGSISGAPRQIATSIRCWPETLCDLHLLFVFVAHPSLSLTQDSFEGMLAQKQPGANQIRLCH